MITNLNCNCKEITNERFKKGSNYIIVINLNKIK